MVIQLELSGMEKGQTDRQTDRMSANLSAVGTEMAGDRNVEVGCLGARRVPSSTAAKAHHPSDPGMCGLQGLGLWEFRGHIQLPRRC